MNMEVCLNNILSAYKAFRKDAIDREWLNYRSYILRSVGSEREFARLLSAEAPYYKKANEWVSGYLSIHKIDKRKDVELLITYVKSFKERNGSRGAFLVLIAAIVAMASPYLPPYMLALAALLPLGVAIFERHYLNENASYANDIAFLLEQVKISMPE